MKCVKCKKETKDNVTRCEQCGIKYETTPVEMFEIRNDVVKKFKGRTAVVVVPENIKGIGVGAFAGSGVRAILVPAGLTRIGDRAFMGCKNITSVTIPENVTTIGKETFVGCENLETLIIPNTVKSIGERAVGDCLNLNQLTVPNSVTKIDERAFEINFLIKNEDLKTREIRLPKVFKDIEFKGCEKVNFTFE